MGHLQTINMKLTEVLCAVVLDGINKWNVNFTIKAVHVEKSDFVM